MSNNTNQLKVGWEEKMTETEKQFAERVYGLNLKFAPTIRLSYCLHVFIDYSLKTIKLSKTNTNCSSCHNQ